MSLTLNNNSTGIEPENRLKSLYIREIDKILPASNSHGRKSHNKTIIGSDLIKITNLTGEIPTNKQIEFIKKVNKEIDPQKAEKINDTIKTTKTLLSITGQIAKISNHDEFSDLFTTSDGALTASSGLIGLKKVEPDEINSKIVMSSISQVANGVGSVLNAANIPEAELLMLTGRLAGMGAEQQNLTEQINKKDSRGIIGTTVSLAKAGWGSVVSSVNVAKLSTNVGEKIGIIKPSTVAKISATATKISSVADKIAVPFAVAGTGLSLWDWQKSNEKIKPKQRELLAATIERMVSPSDYGTIKTDNESTREKVIKKEIGVLKTDSSLMGISFGVSAISSTALITSIALPEVRFVTEPLALVSGIAASVIGTIADGKTRESISNTYNKLKGHYNVFVNNVNDFIFSRQPLIN